MRRTTLRLMAVDHLSTGSKASDKHMIIKAGQLNVMSMGIFYTI
tara:strand:- start:1869 stop:2000 length:132 start_codon:yes stop_codon:yes gene_type:complete